MRTATATALLLCVAACGDNQTVLPDHQAYVVPDAGALPCVPNLDGRIDANELVAAVGIPEHLLVSPAGSTRQVNLAGTVDADGQRVWDLSADDGTDQIAAIEASGLDGKWYASSFTDGQFASPLDVGDTLEGIYVHTDAALFLLGVASTDENPPNGKTLYRYTQPVVAYQFPLQPGAHFVSSGTIQNGTVESLPYAGRDTYDVSVDSAGELVLPDLTFTQSLRVKIQLTQEPAVGASIVTQQTSWLFECYGEVARATSQQNEQNPDFTTAAELRRLSLQRSTP